MMTNRIEQIVRRATRDPYRNYVLDGAKLTYLHECKAGIRAILPNLPNYARDIEEVNAATDLFNALFADEYVINNPANVHSSRCQSFLLKREAVLDEAEGHRLDTAALPTVSNGPDRIPFDKFVESF